MPGPGRRHEPPLVAAPAEHRPAAGPNPGLASPRVAAIIPAHNEEPTIGGVVQVLVASPLVTEIIVVSDGSTDGTARVARERGARVVELPVNMGKGAAMRRGLDETDAPVVLFVDADLVGLTPQHVTDLLQPVLSGEVEMTVGVFDAGRLATDLAQKIAPFLSGQRAMRRELLEQVPEAEKVGYGIEVALSRYAARAGVRVKQIPLRNVAQVMKEEKLGLIPGLLRRFRMYWEILRSLR